MVAQPDWAGGGSVTKKPAFNWQAGNLSLQRPAPSKTMWPAGNLSTQAPAPAPKPNMNAPYYGGTVPSPAQAAPTQYGYAQQPNGLIDVNRPLSGGAGAAVDPGTGIGNGGGGAVQQGPAHGSRAWYNSLAPEAQQAEEAKYLGGDSDYQSQLSEYDRALKDFISRITGQIDNYNDDAKLATEATDKNMNISMDDLGQDFGARGLSYSGLATKAQADLGNRFNDQKKNIDLVRGRNVADAQNRRKDYESENSIGRGNAKRSALARMVANQSLIDSGTAF